MGPYWVNNSFNCAFCLAASAWVNRKEVPEPLEERAAYLGAILATQAHWLTERLMERQARDFKTGGGFSERLYRARIARP